MYIWERVAKSWKHGTVLYIIIKSQERPYNNNNIFIKIIIKKNLINNKNNNIFMWPTVYFAHLRSKKHLQNASNKKKMFFTCPTAIGLALSTFKAKQALINIIKVLITKVYACYLFIFFIYIYNWIDIARREDLNSKSFGWKYFEVSVELQIMFVISNFINVYFRKKQIIITLARL